MDIIVESVKLASTFHGHKYKKFGQGIQRSMTSLVVMGNEVAAGLVALGQSSATRTVPGQ
jgi:hypothetical protein